MHTLSLFSRSIIFAAGLSLLSMTAVAAPSGGSSGGSTNTMPSSSPKKMKCKRGEVVRTVTVNGVKKKKCVKATAGIIPNEDMYEQGNALALEGEYNWALDVLELADQSDPRVLNMQGYSHRKSGRLDVAVGYYQRALAMNPDFVRAREYLGEGYASAGQIDLAKLQLAEIEKRCGINCVEYKDLAKAIAAASN